MSAGRDRDNAVPIASLRGEIPNDQTADKNKSWHGSHSLLQTDSVQLADCAALKSVTIAQPEGFEHCNNREGVRERAERRKQAWPLRGSILLGQGGMGEVCRARDTSLKPGRSVDVALKVLPGTFLRDPVTSAEIRAETQIVRRPKR